MKDLFSLEGKIALVTGGSVGIGAMIAEGFVNFGAKVYLVARHEEALQKKQAELLKIGPCEYIAADVSSAAGIQELAKRYGEREQSLDIWSTTPASATVVRRSRKLQRKDGMR